MGTAFARGQRVPGTKYTVVEWIGAGGMGVVYLVEKPPNIRGVLKLMSASLAREEQHRRQFFDEVRVIAELEHPNIVRVFDYDALPDGTPFYVMEVLTGQTVREVLSTLGRLPPAVAYEITRQLLEALHCAHAHPTPVVHRDIKPDNIFLHTPRYGEPIVKLIDFGVSTFGDRQDEAFAGTPSYAAPEQIACEPVTPASDLYAVGLVLYEMLAGAGPFDHHTNVDAIMVAQMREPPRPISELVSGIPESTVQLLEDVLAKAPRDRPADARAFAARLHDLQFVPASEPQLAASSAAPPAHARGEREEAAGAGPLSRVLHTVRLASGPAPVTPPVDFESAGGASASASLRSSALPTSRTGVLVALGVAGAAALLFALVFTRGRAEPPRSAGEAATSAEPSGAGPDEGAATKEGQDLSSDGRAAQPERPPRAEPLGDAPPPARVRMEPIVPASSPAQATPADPKPAEPAHAKPPAPARPAASPARRSPRGSGTPPAAPSASQRRTDFAYDL